MNSITAYGHCFTSTTGLDEAVETLEKSLEKIGCKEARYLTFRFRKPIIACMDQSLYISQVSKNKAYGISYISVMGN